MASSDDDTILPPRRPVNFGGLDGDTVLPQQNAAGIHVPGDVIDNRYTVIREIGRGGMGVVYEVEDQITMGRYAIKRLLPDYSGDSRIVSFFVRECTTAERFSAESRFFVTTKTVGHDCYGFYVLMELISAPTLRTLLLDANGHGLPIDSALPIFDALLEAIADLHCTGYVHRDLKPENIFVLQSSNQVRVKLVDFGLTKEADESTFTPFGGAGSTRYMAPELFRGGSGTIASDTFAFGVIAYELLCGEPPSGIAQPIIELRPSVSPYVSELITRCMSGKPESRPDLRDFRNLDLSDTVTLTLDKEPKSTQLGTNQHFGSTEKSTSTLTIVGQQGILVKVNGDSLFEPYEYTVSGPVGQVTNIDVSVEWSGVKLYRGLVALVVGQNETLLLESAVQLRGQLPDWARVRTAKGHVTLPTYGLASDLQYAEVLYNGSVQSRIDLEKRSGDVEVTVSHGLSTIGFTQSDFITIQDTGGTSLRFPHKMLVPLAGEFVTLKLSSRNQQSSTIKFYVLPGQQQLNPMNPAMLDKHDRMSLFNICCPHISKYLQSMERIEAALFDMGSTTSDNQQPVHKVSLTSFRIGSKPFNVAAWREYCLATGSSMPDAPEWGWIDDHPIVNVSWNDIMGNNGFCSWLKSVTGQNYELPTEAQWEYVARGGDKCRNFPWGDDFDSSLAWSSVDSPTHLTRTASVDRTTRIYINGFALEDLVGNVWEWCSNWYVGKYSVSMTKKSVTSTREVPMHGIRGLLGETVMEQFTEEISHPTLLTNPKGPSTGTTRTLRGGSWASNKANRLTVSYRYGQKPDLRENDNGFRLCINEK